MAPKSAPRALWDAVDLGRSMDEPCDLEAYLPQVKDNDSAESDAQIIQRKAVIRTMRAIHKYPDLATSADSKLDDLMSESPSVGLVADTQAKGSTTINAKVIGQLDAVTCADIIAKHSKLTFKTLEKCKTFNDQSLIHIVCHLMRCSPSTRIPEVLRQDKALFMVTVDERIKLMGNVLAEIGDNMVREDGEIKWHKIGPYEMEWDASGREGRRISFKRNPGFVEIPEYAAVSTCFTLKNGWSEDKASFQDKCASSYVLIDYFKDGEGPRATQEYYWTGKATGFEELAASEKTKYDVQCSAAAPARGVQENEHFMESTVKEKKRKITERARDALKKRKEEDAGKRELKLNKSE